MESGILRMPIVADSDRGISKRSVVLQNAFTIRRGFRGAETPDTALHALRHLRNLKVCHKESSSSLRLQNP